MPKLVKFNEKTDFQFLKEMPDGSVRFTCPKAIIEYPSTWIDHNISEVRGSDVYIFALLEIKVFKDDEAIQKNKPESFFFKYLTKILTSPSRISSGRDENGEKTEILEYTAGDAFIKNKNIIIDSTVAECMLNLMTLGYFPNLIEYQELANFWAKVSKFNDVGLDSMSMSSIELIVSELCRDSQNYARPFRHKLRENPKTDLKSWKIINIKYLPRYNSVFASLTAGDPKSNIVSICSRLRNGETQKYSPVEEAIS